MRGWHGGHGPYQSFWVGETFYLSTTPKGWAMWIKGYGWYMSYTFEWCDANG